MKSLYLFILLIVLISCQKNNKTDKIENSKISLNENLSNSDSTLIKNPTTTEYFFSSFAKSLDDTIEQNTTYKFDFDLSEVIDSNKVDELFFFLYLTNEKGNFYLVEEIKKVNHTEFTLDENGVLGFNFMFENLGNQFLSGVIEEVQFLKNEKESDSLSIRKKEFAFKKIIYVN